jgi:hypothetical protein
MVEVLEEIQKKYCQAHPAQEISREQFFKAINELPRVRGERVQWARGLGLDGELARLLPKGDIFDGLKGLKHLVDVESMVDKVCWEFITVLASLLRMELVKLCAGIGRTRSEVEEHMNTKFVLDGAFVGRFATLDDFYRGPEGLIGMPNPRISDGMYVEHNKRGNCDREFTTRNYNVTTTPKTEWKFVVEPEKGATYPHTPKDRLLWPKDCGWKGNCGREVIPISEFMEKEEAKRADLGRDEVIATRLYTGPMFVLYNAVLRGFPDKDVDCLKGTDGKENRYETTIFTISSAITKISKVTSVPPNCMLYRGLGGMILPRQFWERYPECQVSFVVASTAGSSAAMVLEMLAGCYGEPTQTCATHLDAPWPVITEEPTFDADHHDDKLERSGGALTELEVAEWGPCAGQAQASNSLGLCVAESQQLETPMPLHDSQGPLRDRLQTTLSRVTSRAMPVSPQLSGSPFSGADASDEWHEQSKTRTHRYSNDALAGAKKSSWKRTGNLAANYEQKSAKYLPMRVPLPWQMDEAPRSMAVRIAKEAKEDGEGRVHMSVALGVSKESFFRALFRDSMGRISQIPRPCARGCFKHVGSALVAEGELEGLFREMVEGLCGHGVEIVEVADKPKDFRGGGEPREQANDDGRKPMRRHSRLKSRENILK